MSNLSSTNNSLVSLFESVIINNPDTPALSDYKGETLTYSQVGAEIARIHKILETLGLSEGDKVALLGKNSTHWGIIYIAVVTYGTVIVPVLPDFRPSDVHQIINHSDSKILFCEDSIFKTLDLQEMPDLKFGIRIKDFSMLFSRDDYSSEAFHKANESFIAPPSEEIFKNRSLGDEQLLVISYTSGTSGFSKGVMLPHRSLLENIIYGRTHMPLDPGDRILSFLPLAHAYGCADEFLFPFTLGCHITFLTRIPSPTVIMEAFAKIKPSLILSVPLVIEKIYKTKLLPVVSKPSMKILLAIPGIRNIILGKMRKKLHEVLGGEFRELVIGGAAFNAEAEKLFRKMRFPFTVGYGMTECGPLISYRSWTTTKLYGSGKAVDALEIKIDSADPEKISGEIMVKGRHVMLGYYKNPDATKAILEEDGWLHTGDIGVIDKDGNVFIRGRQKSMILGPSGKNIYPEEIEAMLSNMSCILECLVVERNNRPFALIFPDYELFKNQGLNDDQQRNAISDCIDEANHHLPKYAKLSGFEIRTEEFEKTPKKNIRRFLYN